MNKTNTTANYQRDFTPGMLNISLHKRNLDNYISLIFS